LRRFIDFSNGGLALVDNDKCVWRTDAPVRWQNEVTRIFTSFDGALFAAKRDVGFLICRTDTGEELLSFDNLLSLHYQTACAFSQDNSVVGISHNKTIQSWAIVTGTCDQILSLDTRVNQFAWCGEDLVVHVYDAIKVFYGNVCLRSISFVSIAVVSVALALNGSRFVAKGLDDSLYMANPCRDPPDATQLFKCVYRPRRVSRQFVSVDGSRVVYIMDRMVCELDPETAEHSWLATLHYAQISRNSHYSLSPDASTLCITARPGGLRTWVDLSAGRKLLVLSMTTTQTLPPGLADLML
jgi:WD40 repeat protein